MTGMFAESRADAVQIPYFDIESRSSFEQSKYSNQLLLLGYGDLHITPTLDQSYYLGLIDTQTRDDDQVVTKVLDLDLRTAKPVQGSELLFQFLAEQPVSQQDDGTALNKEATETAEPERRDDHGNEAALREKKTQPESQETPSDAKNHETADRKESRLISADDCSQAELRDEEPCVDTSRLLMVPQLWLWKIDSRAATPPAQVIMH